VEKLGHRCLYARASGDRGLRAPNEPADIQAVKPSKAVDGRQVGNTAHFHMHRARKSGFPAKRGLRGWPQPSNGQPPRFRRTSATVVIAAVRERACVKNVLRHDAVSKMKGGPSESARRSRLQTAVSCWSRKGAGGEGYGKGAA
jgi:hypothetical protein